MFVLIHSHWEMTLEWGQGGCVCALALEKFHHFLGVQSEQGQAREGGTQANDCCWRSALDPALVLLAESGSLLYPACLCGRNLAWELSCVGWQPSLVSRAACIVRVPGSPHLPISSARLTVFTQELSIPRCRVMLQETLG